MTPIAASYTVQSRLYTTSIKHLCPLLHTKPGGKRQRCWVRAAASSSPLSSSREDNAVAATPTTRLQREAQQLLSIDVEYSHFRPTKGKSSAFSSGAGPGPFATTNGPTVINVPVEVCIVDVTGHPVLHSFCNPLTDGDIIVAQPPGTNKKSLKELVEEGTWRRTGGVDPGEWETSPPLSALRREVSTLITGRPLIGHNLSKDLAALGIDHPEGLRRDTMRYAVLQGEKGLGRALAELAEKKLGWQIQKNNRHCPR